MVFCQRPECTKLTSKPRQSSRLAVSERSDVHALDSVTVRHVGITGSVQANVMSCVQTGRQILQGRNTPILVITAKAGRDYRNFHSVLPRVAAATADPNNFQYVSASTGYAGIRSKPACTSHDSECTSCTKSFLIPVAIPSVSPPGLHKKAAVLNST